MDPFTYGAISLGSSIIGGLFGYQGQRETNASNEGLSRYATDMNMADANRNRLFQADQANAQMAFQRDMSNTSYQRGVADLRAAGINPLHGVNNGASTPSGASGGGAQGTAQAATMQNPNVHMAGLGSMVTGALEAMTMAQGLDKQKAETEFIRTQNKVKGKEIPRAEITNDIYDIFKPYIQKLKSGLSSGSKFNMYDESSKGAAKFMKKLRIPKY